MRTNKQVIKLKPADLKKALVKGLSQSAWQAQQTGRSTKEQIHLSPKEYQRRPKFRKNFHNLEENF